MRSLVTAYRASHDAIPPRYAGKSPGHDNQRSQTSRAGRDHQATGPGRWRVHAHKSHIISPGRLSTRLTNIGIATIIIHDLEG